MYFKVSMRTNPETGEPSGYFRLVESYRNENDRVCHRTLLNVGFLDNPKSEHLNAIQKILTLKTNNPEKELFDFPFSEDPLVIFYVEKFYNQMVATGKIDCHGSIKSIKKPKDDNLQMVYVDSLTNKDIKEIGAEWLAYQALTQLKVKGFLLEEGWTESDAQLAITHIISRAVYPASELKTSRWIQDNSAVCEITGCNPEIITKDKLYKITKKLFELKDKLEQHLSIRTNELFDIQDTILLYDLTNTYFEGRKENSTLAKFGRSKEKRSDAKLVVLALVINPEGFIKYSSIHEGNMSDPKTLAGMVENLRKRTSVFAHKALVVMDAGIATNSNLEMLKEKGYDYLCVSRSSLKDYHVDENSPVISVTDNKKQKIELCKATRESETDYFLKVNSQTKALKETAMNQQFKERFELELQKISDSLQKKGGVKLADKVYERIGRAKQKFPSIQRHFEIEVKVEEAPTKKNSKKTVTPKRTATSLTWTIKKDVEINNRSGIYFLRTSLEGQNEATLWKCYNTIREIEATFRVLKTELDLRPIYHQNDDSTMAHLHLGILAYWVVNTIRFQLKSKGIKSQWRELVRIMNTQKVVTTSIQNIEDDIIHIRKCSEPTPMVKAIYDAINFKYAPFTKRKFVVHKKEIEESQIVDYQKLHPV